MRARLTAALFVLTLAAPAGAVDHSAWDALLRDHVKEGLVDYAGLAEQREELDAYLELLARSDVAELGRREAKALWINAYNARMVQLVLDHYPIAGQDRSHPPNSVLQVPGIFKRFPATIANRAVSLDAIEHQILRPQYRDARVHAALVCASGSCPELRAEAYTAEKLDRQLNEQSERFLRDQRRNEFDLETGVARLSRIFEWFSEDFVDHGASLPLLKKAGGKHAGALAFAASHAEPEVKKAILAGRMRVEFLPYDWSLNDQAAPPSFGR